MSNGLGMTAQQPESPPALLTELNKMDRALDILAGKVDEIRNQLSINLGENKVGVAPPRPVSDHKVQERANNLNDMVTRLNCQIELLAPVLAAVREI